MKGKKNLIGLLCIVLIMNTVLFGCTKTEDGGNPDQTTQSQAEKTFAGRIVKIDDTGVHVQVGDKVERYNVKKETADKYYVGETINVKQSDNENYDIVIDEKYDYNKRATATGDAIATITGTIGEIANDFITTVTEMGNVKVTNPGNLDLKSGAQVMIDYVEMPGGNQMISYYDESSKLDVKVKKVSRDKEGMMQIAAVGKDNKEYDIYVKSDTTVNFQHSKLAENDEIIVYPQHIGTETPAVVQAKLILKK